jgi:hypothetical protein
MIMAIETYFVMGLVSLVILIKLVLLLLALLWLGMGLVGQRGAAPVSSAESAEPIWRPRNAPR